MDFRCKKNGVKWSKIDRIGLTRDYLGSKKIDFFKSFLEFRFFFGKPPGALFGGVII